jgi:hypothetical protein
MSRRRLDPPAAALMQAVRGVGYDAKAAIADLIDNSIAASCENVWIRFFWHGADSTVAVLDDGHGMSPEQLDLAMTLGSTSPLAGRGELDLGRFGLGLKTASLSQCSRLVVASKCADRATAVRIWDLSVVQESNDWLVEDEPAATELPFLDGLEQSESGTLVLWRHLDRLVGSRAQDDEQARLDFQRVARDVEAHLSMTFHRYIEGAHPRLRLYVQGDLEEFRVRPWDPFCTDEPATQVLPEARRATPEGSVAVQGFVLPHKDRFTRGDYEKAGGASGWVSQQGFYVYRNERLLVPGSWLGLGSPRRWVRDEQHKLARLRLDIPNSLDTVWSIDIKKSAAKPPLALREWLGRIAERVRVEAREVFVHRGNRAPAAVQARFSPAWISGTGDAPSYRVNREHPLVASLFDADAAVKAVVESVLRLLESTVPVHRIWLDVSEKPEAPPPTRAQLPDDVVEKLARDLLVRLEKAERLSRRDAIARLRQIEPFDQYAHLLALMEG